MTARERRVVVGGTVVVTVALLVTYGLMPLMRSWQTREVLLQASRDRAAQLAGLVAKAPELERAAALAEQRLADAPRRVVHARSTALAASALHSLLQDAADGAGVAVNRVSVDADADSSGALTASLSVYGDVYGLTTLLRTLSTGPRVADVQRLTIQHTSALRGAPDVIQITLGIRAPVMLTSALTGSAP